MEIEQYMKSVAATLSSDQKHMLMGKFPHLSTTPQTLTFPNPPPTLQVEHFLNLGKWGGGGGGEEEEFSGAVTYGGDTMEAMREMMFRMAVMQPAVHIDPESVKAPRRRNVRISKDPQSVAARRRRERISERIRILQRLVPGGTKMDTASMLDEAIHYVKFLKSQLHSLRRQPLASTTTASPAILGSGFPVVTMDNYGSATF